MADDPLPELDDYDFELPTSAIAQTPTAERDRARLLVVDRSVPHDSAEPVDSSIRQLPEWLSEGDLIVVNRTRVVAARLRGAKASGGRVEALLLEPIDPAAGRHRALLRSSGRIREGLELHFAAPPGSGTPATSLAARVTKILGGGEVELSFPTGSDPHAIGEPPLPPYIRRDSARDEDRERYQTVFADAPGAVAAPTAGLHLTEALLERLAERGVERASVVLHVGLGTFKPLARDQLDSGQLHAERYELPDETAAAVAAARARGSRVVAIGTTTARVLEHCANDAREVAAGAGETRLFLRPGDRFRVVDALLTNFHLPRSSLLMLVSALAGRERVLAAYRTAVERGYRFYSYGDAMLVL